MLSLSVLRGVEKEIQEVDQILGMALGYPRYCDDPKNFPNATDADGVCTGEHTIATLAEEAAQRIERLEDDLELVARYSGIEGRACPLCRYEEGVFVMCQMHTDMENMRLIIKGLTAERDEIRQLQASTLLQLQKYTGWQDVEWQDQPDSEGLWAFEGRRTGYAHNSPLQHVFRVRFNKPNDTIKFWGNPRKLESPILCFVGQENDVVYELNFMRGKWLKISIPWKENR